MQAKVTEVYLDEEEMKRIRKFKPRLPKGEATFKNGRSKPVVFPCDMTDLFGAWVSVEWLDRIFQAMWMCQDVDWLVLTKRTNRMYTYLLDKHLAGKKPLNNIYLGCSVENQKRANERMQDMEAISQQMGWKTWVSFEPALEAVNWGGWEFLNGLICGGESGVNARPMPPEAAREAWGFCSQHGIPFFFKQWGEWIPLDHLAWVTDATTFKHKPVEVQGTMMVKVGKGLAGRKLYGFEYSDMP
jgi:protein gp37